MKEISPLQVPLCDSSERCSESHIANWPLLLLGQRLLSRTCSSYRRKGSRYLATNRRDLRVWNTFFIEHLDGSSSACIWSLGALSTSLKSNAFTRSATNKFRTWKRKPKHSVLCDYKTTFSSQPVGRSVSKTNKQGCE